MTLTNTYVLQYVDNSDTPRVFNFQNMSGVQEHIEQNKLRQFKCKHILEVVENISPNFFVPYDR